jgi:Helix-turn-helix domain
MSPSCAKRKMLERLFTETELAGRLGISPRHLSDLRKQGLIPYIALGRCIRYKEKDVVRAIEKLTVMPLPLRRWKANRR